MCQPREHNNVQSLEHPREECPESPESEKTRWPCSGVPPSALFRAQLYHHSSIPLLEQSHYLTAWQNFPKSNLKCIFMHCLCSPDGRQGHGAWVGYGSRSHYRLLWRPSLYIWSSRQTLEGRWTVWCQAAKSQMWQLREEMEKIIVIFNSGFDNNAKKCMYA